jgi:hypothetical protein
VKIVDLSAKLKYGAQPVDCAILARQNVSETLCSPLMWLQFLLKGDLYLSLDLFQKGFYSYFPIGGSCWHAIWVCRLGYYPPSPVVLTSAVRN